MDPFPGMLATPVARHPYSYGYASPTRYIDPSGLLSDDELKALIGEDWQALKEYWQEHDPYWAAVVEALQGGDILTASELPGWDFQFQGSGSTISIVAYHNGTNVGTTQFWELQAQGAYGIQRPGDTTADMAALRDRMFDQYESAFPNTLLEPACEYSFENGRLRWRYLGGKVFDQSIDCSRWKAADLLGSLVMKATGWKDESLHIGGALIEGGLVEWLLNALGVVELGPQIIWGTVIVAALDVPYSLLVTPYDEPNVYSARRVGVGTINPYLPEP